MRLKSFRHSLGAVGLMFNMFMAMTQGYSPHKSGCNPFNYGHILGEYILGGIIIFPPSSPIVVINGHPTYGGNVQGMHQIFGGMYNSVSTKTRIQPNFGYKLVLGCEKWNPGWITIFAGQYLQFLLLESPCLLRNNRKKFAGEITILSCENCEIPICVWWILFWLVQSLSLMTTQLVGFSHRAPNGQRHMIGLALLQLLDEWWIRGEGLIANLNKQIWDAGWCPPVTWLTKTPLTSSLYLP